MNCQMNSVTVTYRDGRVAQLENIYIRGSKIRYAIITTFSLNDQLSYPIHSLLGGVHKSLNWKEPKICPLMSSFV